MSKFIESFIALALIIFGLCSPPAFAQSEKNQKSKPNIAPAITQSTKDFTGKFVYDISLSVDFNRRSAYLKKMGEEPSSYEKALSFIRGSVSAGEVEDNVALKGNHFIVNSVGSLSTVLAMAFDDQKMYRNSAGTVSASQLSTTGYFEKRGNSPILKATIDYKTNQVKFFNDFSPRGIVKISQRVLDPASIPYLFIGRDLPVKPVTFLFTDGRKIKTYTLMRGEEGEFTLSGQKIRATRYYKTTSKDDDTALELWFSEGEHYPLRYTIGLQEQYGATIKIDLTQLPK